MSMDVADTSGVHSAMTRSLECVLQQSARDDRVYEFFMTALAEVPEALLPECPEDLLYKLVSSLIPDVTSAEVVNAANTLASRAVALREALLGRKHHPQFLVS
jgi:hypothetical protein